MSEPAVVPTAPLAALAAPVPVVDPASAAQPAAAPTSPAPAVVDHAAEVEKWKAIARQNEARAKANADAAKANDQQRELLAKVAAQLGLSEAAPDPAAITAKLEAAERASKSAATELAVLRAAARLGADGDALLDSRQFAATLVGIDASDTEGVATAIKAALAANPGKYSHAATTPAPPATGAAPAQPAQASTAGDFNSGPGGVRQWTQADVDRASPTELKKAMDAGMLKAYLSS
jgi:hypothetical protein